MATPTSLPHENVPTQERGRKWKSGVRQPPEYLAAARGQLWEDHGAQAAGGVRTNPSDDTENNAILEGMWLGRFFCDDSAGQKTLAGIVPCQLSTDNPKSSSAQQSRHVPGESGWCACHRPFPQSVSSSHIISGDKQNVVFFRKLGMTGQPEEPWIFCCLIRKSSPLLHKKIIVEDGIWPSGSILSCLAPNCRGRYSHPLPAWAVHHSPAGRDNYFSDEDLEIQSD